MSGKVHDFGRTKINNVEPTFNRTSCQKKYRITQYYFACDRLWILSAAMFIFAENFSNRTITIFSFGYSGSKLIVINYENHQDTNLFFSSL